MAESLEQRSGVLCIDLDGTLVRTDLLHEAVFALLRRNPLYLLCLFVWLLRGRAYLKRAIAQRITLNVELLPYNYELLDELITEQGRGRKLVLATASDELLAEPIAKRLGIFSEVLASDGVINLKGKQKADILIERYGIGNFDYVGNDYSDIAVWAKCRHALVVNNNQRLFARASRVAAHCSYFHVVQKRPLLWRIIHACRLHQWVKNTLLFVPAVMAHDFSMAVWVALWQAFLAFGCCASSVYIVNDLVDLEADRQNRQKRKRPFASGELSLIVGALLAPALLVFGFALAFYVSLDFAMVLLGYYVITCAYSFGLKRLEIIDILTLAGLYTIRVLAGGVAADVKLSPWMLAFAMFMFLSLGCVKRFAELRGLRLEQRSVAVGRGYRAEDLEQVALFGSASGYIAVLVLALYINSPEVVIYYARPEVLWLLCPLLLYWISRIWLLAQRGQVDEDPIIFALSDRVSYLVGIFSITAWLAAVWG